ncbi:hypothetical protein ACCI51_14345 [Microbulbifer echini]|uniref:Ceramidase n=1 Tax=Microbulbifer echini TaxID=1529067 RepID=A0ABV4NRL9_9GAMM|nr:hypothetical protein [uncultured Microbulbifer sp.]
MIKLTDVPAQQMSAITDFILTIAAVIILIYLCRPELQPRWKRNSWIFFYGLLVVVSFLAGLIHGLQIPENIEVFLWYILLFLLGAFLASFVVAVMNDLLGESLSKKGLPYICLASLIFFWVAATRVNGFVVFVTCQILIMIPVIIGYSWLGLANKLRGSWYMVLGAIVSVISGIFQLSAEEEIVYVWVLGHNSFYHLVQAVGVLFFFVGVAKSFQIKERS